MKQLLTNIQFKWLVKFLLIIFLFFGQSIDLTAQKFIKDQMGMTAAQREMIIQAFDDAACMSEGAFSDMNHIWKRGRRAKRRAWSSNNTFTEWYGGSRRIILMRRLKRRMIKVTRRGLLVCTEANNLAASTVPRYSRVILCVNWFGETRSRRAAIIVHELVHRLGFRHPNGATDEAAARNLARSNSKRARRSPENYEHLYERYFCEVVLE